MTEEVVVLSEAERLKAKMQKARERFLEEFRKALPGYYEGYILPKLDETAEGGFGKIQIRLNNLVYEEVYEVMTLLVTQHGLRAEPDDIEAVKDTPTSGWARGDWFMIVEWEDENEQ